MSKSARTWCGPAFLFAGCLLAGCVARAPQPPAGPPIWAAPPGEESLTLRGHSGRVHAVVFSPDGQRLASAADFGPTHGIFELFESLKKLLVLWDGPTGSEIGLVRGLPGGSFVSAAFSPDGKQVAAAGTDGVKVWDALPPKPTIWGPATLKEIAWLSRKEPARGVAFSPDGKRLAVGGLDRGGKAIIRAHPMGPHSEGLTLRGHAGKVRSLAFLPDGRRLLSVADDLAVKVWDLDAGKEKPFLQGETGKVVAAAASGDGERLATLAQDGQVTLWDLDSGQKLLSFRGQGRERGLALSPNGAHLALAGGYWDERSGFLGEVVLYDTGTGQAIQSLRGHRSFVNSVAFSPDGKYLASGSDDSTVKVWDVARYLPAGPQAGSGWGWLWWLLVAVLAAAGLGWAARRWWPSKRVRERTTDEVAQA